MIIGVFVGLVAIRIGSLWSRHDAVIADGHARAKSFAHVLAGHLAQTTAAVDAALTQLALHSQRVGGAYAPPHAWTAVLEAAFAGLPGIGSITVVDDKGRVTHSTIPLIVGQSRADGFIFRHFAAGQGGGLIADTPFYSVRDNRPLIPLGRQLVTPEGAFDGIIVATLEPERLRAFYRSVELWNGAVISLVHPTGQVLLRESPTGNRADEPVKQQPAFDLPGDKPDGFLRAPLEQGGPTYLTAYRTLPNPPLRLAVSLNEADILADWRFELLLSGIFVGAVGLLLFAAWLLIKREIRARAVADAALEANQARFYAIMYNAPLIVSMKDPAGGFTFVNRAFEERHGTSSTAASRKTAQELVPKALADLIDALDREVVDTRQPLQREHSYSDADGMHTVLFVKFPLLDRHGNVESVVSFSTDITVQRRAEKWLKAIVDHAPLLISLKDVEGRFIFANRALEQRTGKSAGDILGRTTSGLFDDEYANQHSVMEEEVAATKAVILRELAAPGPDGQRTILFVKFPLLDASGNVEAIGSIGTDVTDQKMAELKLAHAQKMEAIGQLTGGIAHDFNNLLTVILGNAEILADSLQSQDRLRKLAQVTLDAAERSASLTQRLLAFGRRQTLEARTIDVNELIADMGDLIERTLGEQIKIEFKPAQDLWAATVDPSQLETAILNLLVNARDSMPGGGKILIQTSNTELDDGYASMNPEVKPGEYVLIAVTDSGEGMPQEVVERAFEPFFTTKEVGKGTGLGLSMVYGFVKQSEGHVKIYSELGVGTLVRLYLRRADAPTLVPGAVPSSVESLPHGSETILLVEDDKFVRAHTEGQLIELGYHVITAENAAHALEFAASNGKPDLLLTDVVMPGGINGRELADRVRERWPALKVLYTSGYTHGASLAPLGSFAGAHFLSKPFRRRDLAVKVREVLDAPVSESQPA